MKKNKDIIMDNRIFAWIGMGTAVILTIPSFAMKFQWVKPDPNNPADVGVQWTFLDFAVMGALLFGAGSIFIAIARIVPNKYRLIVALGVLGIFFLVWAHLAVGIVDTWPLAGS
jgi:hypothetical protein